MERRGQKLGRWSSGSLSKEVWSFQKDRLAGIWLVGTISVSNLLKYIAVKHLIAPCQVKTNSESDSN